jgi:hypothetical protein
MKIDQGGGGNNPNCDSSNLQQNLDHEEDKTVAAHKTDRILMLKAEHY